MGKLLAPGKLSAPGKRLIPVMAMLAMLIPAAGYALGLGNITMNSALNQPLNAEIELFSVQRGDLKNLVVKLGSDEDFQRVGADRAFFLTKIKFEVVRRKNGTAYVRLNTTKNVTEPFLDFVVEARWPRGRILREFTVLVDPPVLSNEAPAPVSQPAAAARPAAAPAARAAQSTRQAPIRSRAEMAPVSRQAGELTYGPVRQNDTLFEIANQMRPNGVTVNQMMTALLRENPNAFYNGNVNQLKAGFVLRISDPDSMEALTVADASAEIERQHVEWRARKDGTLVRQADAPTGGQVARDGDADADSSRSAADQARLKLVAPGSQGAGSGAGEGDVNQLREDLLLAAEALDANRQETDELKTRLLEMEEQLEAMQRLIMLKDDEMAGMQNQLGVEDATADGMAEMAEPEAVTGEAASDEAMSDEAAIAAMAEAMPDEAAEMPAAEDAMAEDPAAMPAPAAMDEPSLLDDPMVMYGGIGVLVLIIAAVIQRRRKMQDGFEESILNVGGAAGDAGATAENMGGGESSMVSDFAMSEMSGMSGIEADAADVDPISEADVYLAYGRHQQAEDILKEALEKEPERNELKLKLLEVSFAAKDREAFEQGAQKFHDDLGNESDPMWAKVVTMGSQLCPGSDLFGGSSADALKEDLEDAVEAGDDDLLDFDFDIDADSAEGDSSGVDLAADDVFAELEAATTVTDSPAAEEDTSLDFDMGSDAVKEPAAASEEPAAASEEAKDDNSLDFDVSSLDFNLDTDADAGAATPEAADGDGLDFDIEGMDEADDESGDDLDADLEDAFGEVDEVGTKLDLAKAYVDMGDGDGARSILDEVMEEGNDDQKKQAEELLSQLS